MADIQDARSSGDPIEETVSALLDEARWIHDEERSRGERLDNRLGLLVGFAALALVLTAPGSGGFVEGTSGVFLDVFYVGAIVLLAASALLAISILFRLRMLNPGAGEGPEPWQRIGVDDDILDEFTGELATEAPAAIERRMTTAMIGGIKNLRDLNQRRWNVLRVAALGVGAALVLLTAQGILALFAW